MGKKIIRVKRGFHLQGDPAEIHDALEVVRKNNSGEIIPANVVHAARSKRSPLHDEFEWDDKKCGVEHRLEQARYILRAVEVVRSVADGTGNRAYEMIQRVSCDESDRVYLTRDDILRDPGKRTQYVERALSELESWANKYMDVAELQQAAKAVQKIAKKK